MKNTSNNKEPKIQKHYWFPAILAKAISKAAAKETLKRDERIDDTKLVIETLSKAFIKPTTNIQ